MAVDSFRHLKYLVLGKVLVTGVRGHCSHIFFSYILFQLLILAPRRYVYVRKKRNEEKLVLNPLFPLPPPSFSCPQYFASKGGRREGGNLTFTAFSHLGRNRWRTRMRERNLGAAGEKRKDFFMRRVPYSTFLRCLNVRQIQTPFSYYLLFCAAADKDRWAII